MTKKQDHLRAEQSRDKHPERAMKKAGAGMAKGSAAADKQMAHTPKVANDHNKAGKTKPTAKNEAQRTPKSRHDRESQLGASNQVENRSGGKGTGRTPRGAG